MSWVPPHHLNLRIVQVWPPFCRIVNHVDLCRFVRIYVKEEQVVSALLPALVAVLHRRISRMTRMPVGLKIFVASKVWFVIELSPEERDIDLEVQREPKFHRG